MTTTSYPGCRVSVLADAAADAVCQLDDVVQVAGWPEAAGCAVDDALEGIDVLAVALARLGPEADQILAPVRAATAHLRRHLGILPAADEVPAAPEAEAVPSESVPAPDEVVTPPATATGGPPPAHPAQRAARPSRRGLGPVGRGVLAGQVLSMEGERSGQSGR